MRNASETPFHIDVESLQTQFVGKLWCWRGPAPYHFITVPEEACVGIRAVAPFVTYGWGVIPVRVRIGDTAWDTSLFPKEGGYVVPIKDAVRKAEGLAEGDAASVRLTIRS
jgi:hypothetical protein